LLDPPSPQLAAALLELKLCTAADLKRCRKRVRWLARDVPAFDSIWIDALLQLGKLTPFQAELLEAAEHQKLCVGPCVLIELLGQGTDAKTYLARRREGVERLVLKLIDRPLETLVGDLDRLHELTVSLKHLAHPSCVGPHTALRHEDQLVAISRYVPGLHLGELLVRRGRFPASVVAEIGRQLLEGLAALERGGIVHGGIRMNNVRLTSAGVAVLVDAGMRTAIAPELTILARVPPDRYDGIAPELIGTGASPSPRSDLYSLGCLLWHLLAGRPPFPTGDPLAKLAAHQTRPVTDVREWAPDAPAELATQIARFTASDPDERPANCREALAEWGLARRSGRKQLARFRALFNSAAPRAGAANGLRPMRWSVTLALLFVLSGAMLTLLDKGARSEVLRLGAAAFERSLAHSAPETGGLDPADNLGAAGDAPAASRDALAELPPPNADGVILLDSPLAYQPAEIAAVGTLTLRGTGSDVATVLIGDKPLKLWAEAVVLDNVAFARVRPATDSSATPSALVLIETQSLTVRNCRFETHTLDAVRGAAEGDAEASVDTVAIAWKILDRQRPSAGQVHLEDTVFLGTRPAIFLAGLPRQVQCRNCLKLGAGAFMTLTASPAPGSDVRMQLERITLRRADALLRWQPRTATTAGRIEIEANDCVLDMAGKNAALFQLSGSQLRPESLEAVELFGEGTLTNPDVAVAKRLGPDGIWQTVDSGSLSISGVLAAQYKFAGELTEDARDSRIDSHNAPQRHDHPPGIEVAAPAGG
jgi:hypothetical protein